eukprot:tig00020904_g15174.t1
MFVLPPLPPAGRTASLNSYFLGLPVSARRGIAPPARTVRSDHNAGKRFAVEAASKPSPADKLRDVLAAPGIRIMPCCYDGLTAKLIESSGFDMTFMSGFSVAAGHLGRPDTGLISVEEMLTVGRAINDVIDIPCIGDADTGFGNPINVKRTIRSYRQAGFAAAMIEDQVSPKRCGHTRGKAVVDRNEAFTRLQAAVDARNEGADILILARTDARGPLGLDEAIYRAKKFREIGADILFVEAPTSVQEMERVIRECGGADEGVYHLANMLEEGATPILSPQELESMGYKIAAYPLTLVSEDNALEAARLAVCEPRTSALELAPLTGAGGRAGGSVAARAMQVALARLKRGEAIPLRALPESDAHRAEQHVELLPFADVQRVVGFPEYWKEEERYAIARDTPDPTLERKD